MRLSRGIEKNLLLIMALVLVIVSIISTAFMINVANMSQTHPVQMRKPAVSGEVSLRILGTEKNPGTTSGKVVLNIKAPNK